MNMLAPDAPTRLHRTFADFVLARRDIAKLNPELVTPWLRPCTVKVLLVTDGNLNFGQGDFGLSAFIYQLQTGERFYARFAITLAHLRSDVNAEQMGGLSAGIASRITNFRFDEPTHFAPGMYDQVWLFGFETSYYSGSYAHRNSHRNAYPNERLGNAELTTLNTFMDAGGGVFATGDHGALGRGLCGSVGRVRSMRHWDSFPSNNDADNEVSMIGPRRNDTNQRGHEPSSRFSDQSDDVPQTIQPRYFRAHGGAHFDVKFPHPLLCSSLGIIDVMPDHPHEGECMVPPNLTQTLPFGTAPEFPNSITDGATVSPQIVATSMVVAGNTSNSGSASAKNPTDAHSFGGICAYDGHRAGVGRVVTDATWHHFVNVNLIGIFEGGTPGGPNFDDLDPTRDSFTKHDGFMATTAGQAHLAKIREYYVNIAVWIASPAKIACFNSRFWPKLIYSDRIMEAALTNPDLKIDRITTELFYSIGVHARDVLGRGAGQCQTLQFIFDFVRERLPKLIPDIDPWHPFPDPKVVSLLPGFDPMPMVNIALGYAIVSLRQFQPYPPEKFDDDFEQAMTKLASDKAGDGFKLALNHYQKEHNAYGKMLDRSVGELVKK